MLFDLLPVQTPVAGAAYVNPSMAATDKPNVNLQHSTAWNTVLADYFQTRWVYRVCDTTFQKIDGQPF